MICALIFYTFPIWCSAQQQRQGKKKTGTVEKKLAMQLRQRRKKSDTCVTVQRNPAEPRPPTKRRRAECGRILFFSRQQMESSVKIMSLYAENSGTKIWSAGVGVKMSHLLNHFCPLQPKLDTTQNLIASIILSKS